MEITPKNLELNYYPLDIQDITLPQQGMDIGATPETNSPVATQPSTLNNIVDSGDGSIVNLGAIKSSNFSVGVAGWRLDSNGNIEANDGNFRGDITGASGTFSGTITAIAGSIGGWTISSVAIYFDGATDAVSSGMAPADYPFYAGKKYADRATAPFKVEPSGKLTVTDIVATGVINAQSGYLSAGVYVDTVNGIICESGGLNVGVAGHIRGGQTDYNTGTGFFLGYSTDAYKLSIGVPTGDYFKWDGTNLTLTGGAIVRNKLYAGEALTANDAVYINSTNTTADTITQNTQNSFLSLFPNKWKAQTFIATGAKTVNIQIYAYQSGTVGGNVTLSIKDVGGDGKPTGADLISKVIASTSVGGLNSWAWTTFTFATPLDTEIGKTYAIVVQGESPYPNYINWGINTAGGYASGQIYISDDAGGTWTGDAAKDTTFKVNEYTKVAGYVYKANASANAEAANNFIGFAVSNITGGIIGEIQLQFIDSQSGLTPGSIYYLSDTPGAISTSAGTYTKKIGLAIDATKLLINFTI